MHNAMKQIMLKYIYFIKYSLKKPSSGRIMVHHQTHSRGYCLAHCIGEGLSCCDMLVFLYQVMQTLLTPLLACMHS